VRGAVLAAARVVASVAAAKAAGVALARMKGVDAKLTLDVTGIAVVRVR
jgi:hypothetical protein